MPDTPAAFDLLSTRVAWSDAAGRIAGANAACARWLGVSAKRLVGVPLVALEFEGDASGRIAPGDGGAEQVEGGGGVRHCTNVVQKGSQATAVLGGGPPQ